MARSHGKVLASIWRDPDWVALSGDAQRLYMLLLSQSKLTLVGSLDLTPARWAPLCADWTIDTVEATLAELEAADFVLVDVEMRELVIRTFVAHDLDESRMSKTLIKGLWGAWECLSSPFLRSVVVHAFPESLWIRIADAAPTDAAQTRRSPPLEREKPSPFERETAPPFESPVSCHLPPVALQPTGNAAPVPATTPALRRERLAAAAEVIGERAAQRATNPSAARAAVAAGVRNNRWQDAFSLLTTDPCMTPEALAEALEPSKPPRPPELNTSTYLRPVDEVLPNIDPDWETGLDALHAMQANRTNPA